MKDNTFRHVIAPGRVPRRVVSAAAVVGLGTVALTMVVSAPHAAAAVTGIGIDPGISTGSGGVFGVGCTYPVTATVNDPGPVYFGSTELADFNPMYAIPANGRATSVWTPRVPGKYLITASTGEGGGLTFKNVEVVVKPATKVGPACVIAP